MYDQGKTDKLTLTIFKFGRIISFVFVVICFIAFTVGGLMYLNAGPDRLQAPELEEFMPYLDVQSQYSPEQDFSKIDTKRAIINKYDSHIKKIVNEFGYDTNEYDLIVGWLANIPHNRRTRFVDGLYDFLDDYNDWLENDSEIKPDEAAKRVLFASMAHKYNEIFIELVKKEKKRWDASYQDRTNLLLFMVCSLIFLVLFLIIPIMLKIEENTRFFK